jgi:uncharacterized protein
VGLLCYLLGIRSPEQVERDPLVGGIFENLVVIECLKALYNRGQAADLWFFRDSNGNEVDLVWREGAHLAAAEIKSASTFSWGQLKGLERLRSLAPNFGRAGLIHSGEDHRLSHGVTVTHFTRAARWFAGDEGEPRML